MNARVERSGSYRNRSGLRCAYAAVAVTLAAAGQAGALPYSWDSYTNPGTGNWFDAGNWSTGAVPTRADEARVFTGTPTINIAGDANANRLTIGNGAGTGGTVNLTGGSLTSMFDIKVGEGAGANATFNQSGGAVAIPWVYGLWVGNNGTGTYNLSSGTATFGTPWIHGNSFADLIIGGGATGKGTLNIDGGTMTGYGIVQMGRGTGSTGTLNMTAGALNIAHDFWGGFGTTGGQVTINQSGGTITTGTADQYPGGNTINGTFQFGVGNSAATRSTYTMSGNAVLNVNSHIYLAGTGGNNAVGTSQGFADLIMNGGTINVGGPGNAAGTFYIGSGGTSATSSSNGTVTVNAGTINLPKLNASINIGQRASTGTATGNGTLTVNGGEVLVPDGAVVIGRTNGTVGATGTLNLTGGRLAIATLTWVKAASDNTTKTFNWTGGTLDIKNAATDFAMVNNGGTLRPGGTGTSVFTTTGTNGSYTQAASGALALDLASDSAYDGINTSAGGVGTINLAGTVNVTAGPGYAPAFGATFPVLTGKAVSDISGGSATWNLPALPAGFAWDRRVTQNGTTQVGTLSVVRTGSTPVAAGTWTGPGATDAAYTLGSGGGSVSVDAPASAGYVQIDGGSGNWTIGGGSPLTLSASTGPAGLIALGGSHTVDAALNFSGNGVIGTSTSGTGITVNGPVAGAGTITKTGPGSLTLRATNSTFSGNWNLASGTLNIDADTNLGAAGASITASGTLNVAGGWNSSRSISLQGNGLTLNAGGDSTLSGVISGPAGLTKLGTNTLTLGAANTYAGPTVVSAGTLVQGVDNAIPSGSAVVLGSGARLRLDGHAASLGSLTNTSAGAADTVTTGGASLTVGGNNASTVFNGNINGGAAGTFTKVGTGTLDITGVGNPIVGGGTFYAIDVDPSAAINVNGGTLRLNGLVTNKLSLGNDVNVAAGANLSLGAGNGGYVTGYQVHGAGSLTIHGGLVEVATDNDYTGGTRLMNAPTVTLDSMGALGAAGTPIEILGVGTSLPTASHSFLKFAADGTFSHPISGPAGHTIDLDATGQNVTFDRPVSGDLQIYYLGGVTVNAVNTNTSATNVISGTTKLGVDNAFAPSYFTLVNGTLDLNGHNQTSGSLIGNTNGKIILSQDKTLTIGSDNLDAQSISGSYATGYAGILTGPGGLTKTGGGIALLTPKFDATATPYTGPTRVQQGTLWFNLDSRTANGTSGFTVDPGAVLVLGFTTAGSGNATPVISKPITGGGVVQKNNNDLLELTADNSYTGGTFITAGTLIVSKDSNLGAASAPIRFSTQGSSSALQFKTPFDTARNIALESGTGTFDTLAGDVTASGVISGPGNLAKTGSGTLTLTGTSTFTGSVAINNGTLKTAHVGATGGTPGNLGQPAAGANLTFGANQPATTGRLLYTGAGETSTRGVALAGNGVIENAGTGKLTLTGNVALNPFGLTLSGSGDGELAGAVTGTSGVTSVVVTAPGTNYNAAPTVAFSGGGGTGAVATAAFSGTTVSSVTLSNYGTGYTSAPTVALNTPAGKTGSDATATAIVTSGGITKDGAGTWRLSGINQLPGAVTVDAGKLQMAANQTYGGLAVNNAAVAQVAPSGTTVLTTSALTLSPAASLDLADNDLVVTYGALTSPVETVRGYLAAAYNHGGWDQPGLLSSSAAAQPNHATTLGIVDDTVNHLVRVRYTWYGDVDLNGTVDAADLARFAAAGTPSATWSTGDMNLDGTVNADDYALFNLGAALQTGTLHPVVPEPTGLALLSLAALCTGRRRRRQA